MSECTYTTLTCPHCGDTKQILDLICADPYVKELWSDNRDVRPWMFKIFPIQKCANCGKYYFIAPEQHYIVDIDADIETLTYDQLKEARKQFAGTELTDWQTLQLNQELLWAYNDTFHRYEPPRHWRTRTINKPEPEDVAIYEEIAQYFLHRTPTDVHGDILRANLLCQAGEYEKAKEILDQVKDPQLAFMTEAMIFHIHARSTFPIRIVYENELVNYSKAVPMELKREEKDGKYGCVDEEGNWVIEPIYDWIKVRATELCVQLGDKWGYLNPDGSNMTPIHFEEADSFSEGLAVVKLNGKVGVIRRDGSMHLEPYFDHMGMFRDGVAAVTLNGKQGWIRTNGVYLVDPIYDEAVHYGNYIMVSLNGRYGCLDTNGNEVVPCIASRPIALK